MTQSPEVATTASQTKHEPMLIRHALIVFIVVPFIVLMGLRDFMALMAVTLTLEFSETKALYIFLFIRALLFFVCAAGVWKRHRFIGLYMTNLLLLGSVAFNFYLKRIDPVEMSRATDTMIAAFIGVLLLHFMGYFRKTSNEGETAETPPTDVEHEESTEAPPETSTEPEIEGDNEPVAPEQNEVPRNETAEKEHDIENDEPT